jgi:hypothetical protein
MPATWLILLTGVVVGFIVFGRGGGAHAMRKFLVFLLAIGGIVALLALIVYPFRHSHRNVYIPQGVSVPYETASVRIDETTLQAVAPGGVTATVEVAGPSSSGEPAAWARVLLIGLPALAVLAALAALRRSPSAVPRHGSGLWLLAAGAAMLVLLGFFFTGRVEHGAPIVHKINTYPHAPTPPSPPTDRALIDAQWDRLTAPRIPLDNPAAVAAAPAAAKHELQNAAEALQAASEKMAETASEGWLLAAAKAILNTPSKTPPNAPTPATTPEPPQPAPAVEEPSSARPKPEWVLRPPGLVGNVRKVVVSAGPYKTLDECHHELERQMQSVVAGRVAELAGAATGQDVDPPFLGALNVGPDYILRELCSEPEYIEEVEASFGPMKKAHLLLEFTAAQDAELLARWKTHARRDRLAMAGFGATFVVGCLALAFGLLKVDTWTRGYYSKRLFLGVPAAIIGLFFLAMLILDS